jgi:hypothetical protein
MLQFILYNILNVYNVRLRSNFPAMPSAIHILIKFYSSFRTHTLRRVWKNIVVMAINEGLESSIVKMEKFRNICEL